MFKALNPKLKSRLYPLATGDHQIVSNLRWGQRFNLNRPLCMADELQGLAQQGESFLFGSVWVFIMKWFRQAKTGPEPGRGRGQRREDRARRPSGYGSSRLHD